MSKVIKCPTCGKTFQRKEECIHHLKTHNSTATGKLPVNPDPIIERPLG